MGTARSTGDGDLDRGIARTPRLSAFDVPALEQIERRRSELMGVTFILMISFALGMVLVSFLEQTAVWLQTLGGTLNVVRAGLVLLAISFAIYVVDHERELRRLTQRLINERVLAAALSNRLREIASLTEAGSFILPGGRVEAVLESILQAAFELLEADSGSLLLVRDGAFEVACARGGAARFVGDARALTEGIAGYVARSRKPVVIQGNAQLTEFTSLLEHDEAALSSLCVPLEVGSELVGVLSLNVSTGARRYNEYDARALGLFAEHAATVLRNAQLLTDHPSIRAALAELERTRADVVRVMAGEAELHPAERERRAVSTGRRVLVAEDDPALLRVLQAGLETSGYEVLLASDGETTLSRIRNERPHVVLLDLVLPVIDGWGVLERLQDMADRPRIVCLTGKASSRDLYNAWNLGADEYLSKPFDLEHLLYTVDEVAVRSEEERAARRQRALKEVLGSG